MGECTDHHGANTIFSTLDAIDEYWQIEIEEAGRNKTAPTSHRRLNRFISMLFGPRNAFSTFFAYKGCQPLKREMTILARIIVRPRELFLIGTRPYRPCSQCHNFFSYSRRNTETQKLLASLERVDCLGHVTSSRRLDIASHMSDTVRGQKLPTKFTNCDLSYNYLAYLDAFI